MKLARPPADDGPLPDPFEAAVAAVRDTLHERGEHRQQVRISGRTFRSYGDLVPEARGPLNFREFAWQEELYSEEAAHDFEQVYKKATQVGVSTQAIRWVLYHADVQQRTCLYTFPTDDELRDFSRHRMRPVLRASAHLMSRMSGEAVNNVGLKQIGTNGWIYFRGVNGGPVDSVPGDVVVFDEYDTSDQANIEGTERRVTGPQSAGLIRRIGVPSIPGFGIDALYENSDQRVWAVRCECGHWNPMNGYEAFVANVDRERLLLVCAKCKAPIDVRIGEWVATHPDRDVRGYTVPKLLVPGRRHLATLVANSKKTRPDQVEAFHTRDLGEAYAPAEGRLSLEAVRACVRPELRPQESLISYRLTTMGIDLASARACNVTIEEELDEANAVGRKVFVGTVAGDANEVFRKLCWLMQAFSVNMAGIDNGPDGMFAKAFAARFPGRVYRCDFFTPQPGAKKEPDVWNVDDAEQFVSLWRTRVYDAVFERYRLQRVLLPPLDLIDADFPTHLGNLYRRRVEVATMGVGAAGRREKMSTGKVRVDYVKTGPEDYAQCEAYNLAAIELFGRNAGRQQITGAGPVPLAEQIPGFVPSELADYGVDVGYRPGFE